MLSCLLRLDEGDALVMGHSIKDDQMGVKSVLGVVPQEIALYNDLSAHENLTYWGKMSGLRGAALRSHVDEVLEIIGLTDRARDRVRKNLCWSASPDCEYPVWVREIADSARIGDFPLTLLALDDTGLLGFVALVCVRGMGKHPRRRVDDHPVRQKGTPEPGAWHEPDGSLPPRGLADGDRHPVFMDG
jgi:hypothetical protein